MIETLAILVAIAVLGFVALALYFIPAIISHWREQDDVIGVLVLNILLGWTVVGWVVLALWALIRDNRRHLLYAQTH